jgi:predicted Ser/Thr protein kinase
VPDALDGDAKKVLRAALPRIHRETEASLEYEGHMGVSPRAMRTVLLNAAQHPDYGFLSPFAVLHELDELCKQTSEYDFLRLEPKPGGYHDTKELRAIVRRRLLDRLEVELRAASGLVEDVRWAELFDRYVQHVSTWVKGETIRNPVTGEHEKADEKLLREVEGLLGVTQRHEDHRRALISSIAAWAIDHPGERVVNEIVFPELLGRLKTAVYAERRKPVALLVRDYVRLGRSAGERGPDKDLSEGRRRDVAAMRDRLFAMGYDERSALDAASSVLQARFAELVL